MKEERKNIDNVLFDQLDGLSERPPAYIWDGVESALDVQADARQQAREKRNRYALALLFILTIGSTAVLWEAMNMIDKQSVATAEPARIEKSLHQVPAPANTGTGPGPSVAKRSAIDNSTVNGTDASEGAAPSFFTGSNILPVQQGGYAGNTGENAMPIIDARVSTGREQPVTAQTNAYALQAVPIELPGNPLTIAPAIHINPTATSAVQTTPRKKSPLLSRFSLTAFFAPDITTRNLEQDRGNTADEKKDAIEKAEKNGALDYTLGARVDYKLNKRFSIQSGISFSTNTINIADKIVYARYDKFGTLRYKFNLSSGYAFAKLKRIPSPQFAGDSSRSSGSTSVLHYVNIPLAVKYNVITGPKLTVYLHSGLTARFITRESVSTTYDYHGFRERSLNREIEGLKKTYFNGVVGVGAEYALSPRVAVTLFPSFNFATSSINQDAPVKAYPNTVSIASGVKFNF